MVKDHTGIEKLVPKSKTYTYQARIATNIEQESLLSSMAARLSEIERKLFSEYNKGQNISKLKNEFLQKYQITARQFNAIRINLEGKITSLKSLREDYIFDTQHRITKTTKTIKYLTKLKNKTAKELNNLHQKKRLLKRKEAKLAQLLEDKKNNVARMCFGSKKLFKKQFNLKENGYDSYNEWLEEWRFKRNNQFYLIGSKDETMGNQSCIATINDNETINLRIRAPDFLIDKFGKYVTIENVELNYGKEEVLAVIANNLQRTQLRKTLMRKIHGDKYLEYGQAINYRFLKDDKSWKVYITVDKQQKKINSCKELGAIGVDINVSHLAVAEMDRTGNLVNSFNVKLNTYGKSKSQAQAIIGDAVKTIVNYAKLKQKPIVLEQLEFHKKKRDLRERSPKKARMLSSFAYSMIISMLKSRSFRHGIETYEVNPAYSSIIGRIKFARIYPLSIHKAAALVIARRFYRFSERLPRCWKNIPDNKGSRVTLSGLVKIHEGHVWRLWAKVKKNLKAALAEQYQMNRAPPKGDALTGEAHAIPF